MNRDQIVVALAGLAAAVVVTLQAFGVVDPEQGAAIVGVLGTFLAGYRVDRNVAKDALDAVATVPALLAPKPSTAPPDAATAPSTDAEPNTP